MDRTMSIHYNIKQKIFKMKKIVIRKDEAYALGFQIGKSKEVHATNNCERQSSEGMYVVDKDFLTGLVDGRTHTLNLGSNKTFFRDKSGYMVYREKIKLDDVPLNLWFDGLYEISGYSPTEPERT